MKKILLFAFLLILLVSTSPVFAKNTHYGNGQPVREYETGYVNGQKIIKERISGGTWRVVSSTPVQNANIQPKNNLSGRILLQVEGKGEAWYVDPVTAKRTFLGRPEDAFRVMREKGLGISNADLGQIAVTGSGAVSGAIAKKLAGRILLQVEAKGEAWYVDPLSGKRHFLGRPADAFNVMRKLGLGISNADLGKVAVN